MHWGGVARQAEQTIAFAAMVALAAGPAAARFIPPENQPLRQLLVEERELPGASQRFVTEREIVFARTETGYRASVTILRADAAAGETGAMFAAGMAALKGRTIAFQLDREGAIKSIEDEGALWDRFCDAIAAMASGKTAIDARRRAQLSSMATMLRAAPSGQRRTMLGSMLSSLVAGPLADRQPGTQAVTLPARAPDGAETALAGRETVSLTPGALVIDAVAEGKLPGSNDDAHINVERHQRIDVARGLVLESRTVRDTMIGSGAARRRSRTVNISVISFKVS